MDLRINSVTIHTKIAIAQKPPTSKDDEFDDELTLPSSVSAIFVKGTPVAAQENRLYTAPFSGKIPFSAVHRRPVEFKSYSRNVFIPGVKVHINITDNERNPAIDSLNPNLYAITITHGDFAWQIYRRYKHFCHLHQQLVTAKKALDTAGICKTHKRHVREEKSTRSKLKDQERLLFVSRFPKKQETLISAEELPKRIKQLEKYLNNLLSIDIYRNHPETIKFLEISHLSFIYELGIKGKEGIVKKRSGDSRGSGSCSGCAYSMLCLRFYFQILLIFSSWLERWFFIKDQCFGFINPVTGQLGSVTLFDQGFQVSSGIFTAGLQTGIQILTLNRQIVFECWTRRRSREWIQALRDVADNQAKEFTRPNPRNSFAPVRNNIAASWFVDGAEYMAAVADSIEAAKEEVFIADWWLSPEIYLKRPAIDGDYWRLDKLLERKANEGVKIFVLLYKEVKMALNLKSRYSKQRLLEISNDNGNIKVLRHPNHVKAGVFLWAHHEKIVVVDQSVAFLGGIDLCYGRWDDCKHRYLFIIKIGSLFICKCIRLTDLFRRRTSSTTSDYTLLSLPPPYSSPDTSAMSSASSTFCRSARGIIVY
ncbi:hypothetical protein ILUMI_10900 [Ignelater luminosus]|uniref:phospholipase D n=1 Tax=Ignelater luminosus TaxID=2038154 RepID=A0A8K0GD70_IGNLU|nr:hypothetical protein ILUMI_10900 [Ignelater luminosus]